MVQYIKHCILFMRKVLILAISSSTARKKIFLFTQLFSYDNFKSIQKLCQHLLKAFKLKEDYNVNSL